MRYTPGLLIGRFTGCLTRRQISWLVGRTVGLILLASTFSPREAVAQATCDALAPQSVLSITNNYSSACDDGDGWCVPDGSTDWYVSPDASLRISSTDSARTGCTPTGVNWIERTIDGSLVRKSCNRNCGSFDFVPDFRLTSMTPSPHVISFQAQDKAGNKEVLQTRNVYLDNSPPEITSFNLPSSLAWGVVLITRS